ncbi:MAG: glycosyltransferase family 2 protein [Deltaproteobacteria bacterium]|nr:glycosyltransferase family 2 protein [Deltaproteobacteria bacterium]
MPINQVFLSAAIITRNEESNIADCIESLSWADEVVIIDSESTDKTREIAGSLGAKVIIQPFLGHVRQKQLAVDSCEHDWVICLDADERISPELRESIFELFQNTDPESLKNGYRMSRRSFHMGRWIMHGGWYPDKNIRLFNRSRGKWSGVDPHDRVEIEGEAGELKGDLEHFVFRDLSHNVQQNNFFSSISARIFYEENKKPSFLKLIMKPPGKFIETYVVKRGFLDGMPGFIISVGAAYSMFLKYAKLWELHKTKKKQ